MNGFLVVGFNEDQTHFQADRFETYLTSQRLTFSSTQIETDSFSNLIGYQIFPSGSLIDKSIKPNVFLNGKIFGELGKNNLSKLNYTESLDFISKSIDRKDSFYGFDGSCSLVSIKGSKIIFQSDIEGYKRVFYIEEENFFCVSNNLTYILKIFNRRWKIRRNAIISYLLQRESKWPLTFIEGIKALPPLTKATWSKNGITYDNAILSDFYNVKRVNKKSLINDVYSSYERIIKRDNLGKIAVTLSGGVDSNCLTKLYSQSTEESFTAVSLGYISKRVKDTNVYDETVYAEKIAKELKIPFKKYIVDREYFLSKVDSYIETLDQPGHDPSSNFLLNDLLKEDGFDTVVSGMGGDAFFSPKSTIKLTKAIYSLSEYTNGYSYLNALARRLNFKWVLKTFDTDSYIKKPTSFLQLRELQKLKKPSLDPFISNAIKKEIFDEVESRHEHFTRIERDSKVPLEENYLYSILSNPDEYHADIMAQRNDLNLIMPFVSIDPALKLLNGSKFINISNRAFEMELFKGINKELLLKSKSGFSFPYTEWAGLFFSEAVDFFKNIDYFDEEFFDIYKFSDSYSRDESFRNSVYANQVIWKLTVIKRFTEYHSIVF